MTTKPHSNDEAFADFKKRFQLPDGTFIDHSYPPHTEGEMDKWFNDLLAQRDAEVETYKAIIAVASDNAESLAILSDDIMAGNIRRNIVNVLTPPDQTDKYTGLPEDSIGDGTNDK